MVQKACWLSGQGRASLQLVKTSGRDACGKASDLSMESGKLGQRSWRFLEKYLKASTWNTKSLNKTIVFKTLSLALFEHQILEHWGSDTSDPTSRMCHVCLGACTSEKFSINWMCGFDAKFWCSVLFCFGNLAFRGSNGCPPCSDWTPSARSQSPSIPEIVPRNHYQPVKCERDESHDTLPDFRMFAFCSLLLHLPREPKAIRALSP